MNGVRLAVDVPAAVDQLRAAEAFAVDGSTLDQLIDGQAVFELLQNGRPVGAMTLGVHETASGRVLHCTAAAGQGEDLTGLMDRFMTAEGHRLGARLLACETRRPGLVRRLQRAGWRADGHRLTKELA